MKNKYTFAVIAAGTLWGFMGFFRRTLESKGITAVGCMTARCLFAAIVFTIAILLTDKSAFKIKLKDLWCFFGTGIISFLIFGICYFKAMDYMSLSAAAILLYTAPCFVIMMSAMLFNEKITKKKLFAMLLAFLGCCLVSGLGSGNTHISGVGLLLGISAGLCYAMFSIFSRFAINRGYNSFTINFYSCILAGIGSLFFGGAEQVTIMFANSGNLMFSVATGVVTCFLPYLLYTYGLEGLENGKASIMASIEPVVATLVGLAIYHEKLTALSLLGIVLVLSAIVLLNVKNKKETELS